MAAACLSASLPSSLPPRLRPLQTIASSDGVRHGLAVPSASCSSVERKLCFGSGFDFQGKGSRNVGIIARAVELDENQEGSSVASEDVENIDSSQSSEPIPPAGIVLYVGNLPWSVDSAQLAEIFQDHGSVDVVQVMYDQETQRSKGYAFVTMSTAEDAERAIEGLNRKELGGRLLRVDYRLNPSEARRLRDERPPRMDGDSFAGRPRIPNPNEIFVGNLSWGVDDDALKQLLSEYGQVVDARVIHERDTGRSRGFAYATLSNQAEVDTAIQALDGAEYDGRILRVNRASDKPERKSSFLM